MDVLEKRFYWELMMKDRRYSDKKRLVKYGWKAYSQNDEDGIIAEIFRRIGTTSKQFVEIGVSVLENNTLALLTQGWTGTWIDGDIKHETWCHQHAEFLFETDILKFQTTFVTRQNINYLVGSHSGNKRLDLLSIDVDGNDYWLFEALNLRPRVILIEYNATWHPPISITQSYDESKRWSGRNDCGASLSALTTLASKKGYRLVGCCFAGVNSFFVSEELCGGLFCEPFSAENHYEPPRYAWADQSGHSCGIAPFEIIL